MSNPNLLANVSSIAQDGVVVCGAVAAGAAVIVTALATFGVHVDAAQLVQEAGALGAAITLARTTIDSLTGTKTVESVKAAPVTVPAVAAAPPVLAPPAPPAPPELSSTPLP